MADQVEEAQLQEEPGSPRLRITSGVINGSWHKHIKHFNFEIYDLDRFKNKDERLLSNTVKAGEDETLLSLMLRHSKGEDQGYIGIYFNSEDQVNVPH
jgi:hypothetical protein